MDKKFFVHEARLGATSQKGIVICDTEDEAKQTYHAYLGAYAYGHDPNTTFCQAMITDTDGAILQPETWRVTAEEPVEE